MKKLKKQTSSSAKKTKKSSHDTKMSSEKEPISSTPVNTTPAEEPDMQPPKKKHFLLDNIQLLQTTVLSIVLLIGVEIYNIYLDYTKIFAIFTTVTLLDALMVRASTGKWRFPYSWVNIGFGLSFFLRTTDIIIYVFAGFLAVMSKYFIQWNGRHFLNPSNIGIVLMLIGFPYYTWVNTFQWGNVTGIIKGEYLAILWLVWIFGSFITYQVYKKFGFKYYLDYFLPFIALHVILFFTIPIGETIIGAYKFFSVSFFIFVFHMISDPKTVPERSSSRVVYAMIMVFMFYILQFYINEFYSLIMSLTCCTLLLPIIWSLEKQEMHIFWKKVQRSLIFLLTILLLVISFTYILVQTHGQPRLLFTNVCNQIFCK